MIAPSRPWLSPRSCSTEPRDLPVAHHCIFLLGFGTYDLRVYIHSILGSIVYGVFIAKGLLVRSRRFPGWALPIAGGLLFSTLLGL